MAPEIEITGIKSPVTILHEQASMLGDMTKNIVRGDVTSGINENSDFAFVFNIMAPALHNYRFMLFAITYNIDFYPVAIWIDTDIAREIENFLSGIPKKGETVFIIESEVGFIEILKAIFNSNKAKKIISVLLAESKGI